MYTTCVKNADIYIYIKYNKNKKLEKCLKYIYVITLKDDQKKEGFVNKGPEFSFLHNAFGELGSGKSSK